jgi:N6-L-threonylcarbamoyladenine synthase
MIVMGFEGSANKLGIGIVQDDGKILANVRHTFITPPGEGFLPRDTAKHHQTHILSLIEEAIKTAKIQISQIDALAYTKERSWNWCSTSFCCSSCSNSITIME